MIEKVEFQEEKVSSTALRKLIRNGEMEQIPSILGRAYTVAEQLYTATNVDAKLVFQQLM